MSILNQLIFFGGEEGFKYIKERDFKKYALCKENNLNLLYFTYNEKWSNFNYFDKIYTEENEIINVINNLNVRER